MRKRVATPCGGGDLVTKSYPTLATPWTVARQSPLSMGFPRQEYWSGLPFLSPGRVGDNGMTQTSRKTILIEEVD